MSGSAKHAAFGALCAVIAAGVLVPAAAAAQTSRAAPTATAQSRAMTPAGYRSSASTPLGNGSGPPRGIASDRGVSFAPPALRTAKTFVAPSNGQTSLAGRDRSVLTATPPINPAEGTRQVAGQPALVALGPRLNQRLGRRRVELAAGRRLGGGGDFPSREAVVYDPRDLLDYRVRGYENPNQRLGP